MKEKEENSLLLYTLHHFPFPVLRENTKIWALSQELYQILSSSKQCYLKSEIMNQEKEL